MIKLFEEFPSFHATVNLVPSLCMQLEEYASGKFNEPWFDLAFKKADELTQEDKAEILARAFQVNLERLLTRWPRFVELHEWSRGAGGAQALITFTARDWRDLQVLSQLAWMEEEWLAKDVVVCRLANRGKDYSEKDKEALKVKIVELIGLVIPAHREAAQARAGGAEHDSVLSPDFAAAVRFEYCAGGEPGDAAAPSGVPASGRRARTVASGARLS